MAAAMMGEQTSVFLTAIAQGSDVMRYPPGIVILGSFAKVFVVDTTNDDERICQLIAHLGD